VVYALLSLIGAALGQAVVLLDQPALPEQLQFHQELALSLEAVQLRPAPDDFATAPMATQLEAVRPMLDGADKQAVVWLGGDATKLWVSVAFVDEERAVIRMIDLPRDPDPLPRLALAVRELVTTAYAAEPSPAVPAAPTPPPQPPAPTPPWWAGVSAGAVVPASSLAGGPRGATALQLHRQLGPVVLGTELMGQLGPEQARLGLGLIGRGDWLSAGLSIDAVRTQWSLPPQPRAFIGLWHRWESGLTAEARVYLHPLRDRVAQGERRLYDSGRSAPGIFLGWERKISSR